MGWLHLQIKKTIPISPSQQQSFNLQPPPPPPPPPIPTVETSGFSLNDKVSPSVLLIIIILAIVFFISGLLHLLIRFLLRPARGWDPDEMNDVTVLQGQLQQLFHLHDAGVDQSFIDTLPVFNYKSIIGVKSPFDCAVCLSEFEPEDKLRLLPKCSHAFHMECIDTWLLSHSTCPICRASLSPDFSSNQNRSPVVLVLESGSESSREIVGVEREGSGNSARRVNSHLSAFCENENSASLYDLFHKSSEIQLKEDQNQKIIKGSAEKIVSVKLGKFKNVDQGEGCSENNVDKRRCFSMGSFGYVMDESSSLKVPIRTPVKKQSSKKPGFPSNLIQRAAMSECGWDSRREFNGFEAFSSLEREEMAKVSRNKDNGINDKTIRGGRESFSISKIWLTGKKDKQSLGIGQSSRRAVSFRLPLQNNGVEGVEESKAKNVGGGGEGGRRGGGGNGKAISEVEIDRWENGGSECSYYDVEMQSCYSMDSQANAPSFARKTLLWLMGNVNQNKVVHSSFSSNL